MNNKNIQPVHIYRNGKSDNKANIKNSFIWFLTELIDRWDRAQTKYS